MSRTDGDDSIIDSDNTCSDPECNCQGCGGENLNLGLEEVAHDPVPVPVPEQSPSAGSSTVMGKEASHEGQDTTEEDR